LGCDTVSLFDQFQTFQGTVVLFSPAARRPITIPVQHHIPEALMYYYFQSVAQVYSILFRKLHDKCQLMVEYNWK